MAEYDPGSIIESPSAERNKGPILELVLGPVVYPRLFKDILNDSGGSEEEEEGVGEKDGNGSSSGKERVIRVLELAAGCGVHTTYFVTSFVNSQSCNAGPGADVGVEWHPSDPDDEARSSIDARTLEGDLTEHIVPANSWALGRVGGTACQDGNRDKGDAGASKGGQLGCASDYAGHVNYFDLILCVNMIHIAPWEACLGLMECAGTVLRKGGILVCYGPYKVGGTATQGNLKFDVSLRTQNPEWGVRNLEDVVDAAGKQGLEFLQSIEMPANNLSVLFRKK
jgi:SAM-dependent methyltransferase